MTSGSIHPIRIMGSMLPELALAAVPAMEPTVAPEFVALTPSATIEATMERAYAWVAIDRAVMDVAAAVPWSRAGSTTRETESEQSRCKEATHS